MYSKTTKPGAWPGSGVIIKWLTSGGALLLRGRSPVPPISGIANVIEVIQEILQIVPLVPICTEGGSRWFKRPVTE